MHIRLCQEKEANGDALPSRERMEWISLSFERNLTLPFCKISYIYEYLMHI